MIGLSSIRRSARPLGKANQINGAAVVFGDGSSAQAANADLDTTTAGSGLWIVRNLTDGGTVLVNVDIGLGSVTSVSDPSTIGSVGADPGAGTNKLWITVTGTTLRVRNRYAAAKDIGVACVTVYGTPD